MKRITVFAGFLFLLITAVQSQAQTADRPASEALTLPAGTRIELAVTNPVWMRSAKAGDALYAQVDFPVFTDKSIAIPAGTYVQGSILSITRPSRFKSHAEIQALFTTIIFANGYAAQLPALPSTVPATQTSATPPSAAIMKLSIDVSSSNDLLLDNGAQFNLMLASPLPLDRAQIAAANAITRPADPGQLRSATLCRPTPGTPGFPGSPDTVIPGSPGTPDTTIPGGPGQPDIVIPGTPATPSTIIPGTPGTPGFAGRSCPRSPLVVSSEPLPIKQIPTTASAHP